MNDPMNWSAVVDPERRMSVRSGIADLIEELGSHGSIRVFLGTLAAAVFALRVVGRVDHALFLWPVSAVTVGLAVRQGQTRWQERWVLKLSSTAGFLLGAASVGMPLWLASVLSGLNCIDLVLARLLLGRSIQTFKDLKQRRNMRRFAALLVLVPGITGLLGGYPISLFLREPLLQIAAKNILANSLGFAVMFPLVLLLGEESLSGFSRLLPPYRWQAMVAASLFLGMTCFIFFQDKGPFLFLVFPPMVLVLLTMGLEGAVFTSLSLCVIGWLGTSHGHGPIWLMKGTALEHLLILQVFIWVCLITALPIGALLDERGIAEQQTAVALIEKDQSLEENRRLNASLMASNELFTAFMSHGPFASYIKDADGSMLFYNKYLAKIGGVSETAWLGLKDDEIWPAEMAASYRRHDLTVLESNSPSESDDVSPGPDGTRVFWKTLKFPYFDATRKRYLLAGVSFDVTLDVLREAALEDSMREKAALARQIDASRHLFETFLLHNPTQTLVKDEDGRFVFYNREVELFFGINSTEWLGRTIEEVRPRAEAERHIAQYRQVVGTGMKLETIDAVTDVHGEVRQLKSVKFAFQNIHGRTMFARISQDITDQVRSQQELAEANRKLTELAMTDSLTGLSTRRVFEARAEIEYAVARRTGRAFSIVVLDVDNFKHRNDVYGHAAGDEALRVLGTVLSACVRRGDVAARLGGEEFGLLLPETDVEAAASMADRLRSMLRLADHGPVALTVSVGVAHRDDTTGDWQEMLSKADLAMYEAKRNGKDRVVCAGLAAISSIAAPGV